jgi:hypothetical protein
MVFASVGPAAAEGLGLGRLLASDDDDRLKFGKLERLVDVMQTTAPDRILQVSVDRLRRGTSLRDLVAAAALANVRTFGGEDYVGFHTMMAMAPAYHMATEERASQQALPVLKVLLRNSKRIHEKGGELLHIVRCGDSTASGGQAIRDAVRERNMPKAERIFAANGTRSPQDALNELLFAVEDDTEVHRIVMVYRSWDLLDLAGKEQAHTLLRQSIHYCINAEKRMNRDRFPPAQEKILKLVDQHHLLDRAVGRRPLDDAALDRLSRAIFGSTPADAAGAASQALADGVAPIVVGEAIALAANQLVLRDNGRPKAASPDKPAGSIHGDGIGVHACDSANAWRNIAMVANPRHRIVCLLLGAYQVALDRTNRGGDFLNWNPYPREDARGTVKSNSPEELLREAESAIRASDQPHASAAIERYGALGGPAQPVFDLLRRYAVSQDGALHAEKYYRTASEEFAASRPAFRWRQLVALARVTASAYGRPAPGYSEACKLLAT